MAREYAQTKVSIWDDDSEFLDLGPFAKLLYMHLFSRRDLSHAGHLFIREQRWADACFNGNVDLVTDAITELITNRYVIADAKTGELLVRTFIRHDGGYRNSKMRKAIEWAVEKIESPDLAALATESLARCVNGDPDPVPPQVEGQPDHTSDQGSEEASDEGTDPTYHHSPLTMHQAPDNSSSSSSESKSEPPEPEDEEDDLIRRAMRFVAESVTRIRNVDDPFAYKQTVLVDKARIADIEAHHRDHPEFNAEQLAALHSGRELARVIAMTEPDSEPEPPWPVSTYTPPPPVEPQIVPYCDGCHKPAAMMRVAGCKNPDPPASCVWIGATVHHIRPETA